MKTIIDLDHVLPYIGEIGRHQILVLTILSLICMPAAVQWGMIYFLADDPPWQCVKNSTVCNVTGYIKPDTKFHLLRCNISRDQWEYVEKKHYSIVTEFDLYCDKESLIFVAASMIFVGSAFGSIFVGWISDRYGRIRGMVPFTILALCIGFISAFSPVYWVFALSRFLIGFTAAVIIPLMFVLASEIVSAKYRPLTGINLWIWFTLAIVLLGVIAMYFRTWKMILILSTAPAVVLFPMLFFIPESMRWLHVTGQHDRAIHVINRIARFNGKKEPNITLQEIKSETTGSSPRLLFNTKRVTYLSLNIGFAWLVNALVYNGVSLAANDLSDHMYRNYILSSLIEFPSAVCAMLAAMYIGRKRTTQLPLLVGGLFCVSVAAIDKSSKNQHLRNLRVAFGLIGKFLTTLSYDTIFTWTVELYPTQIRSVAMGYCIICSRIGGTLSPWVSKWLRKFSFRLPFILMGLLAVFSAILLQKLPETKNQKTLEVVNGNDTGKHSEGISPANDKTVNPEERETMS